MNNWIAWFARNSVAANLLMFGIIAAGLFSLGSIALEIFPEIASETLSVVVAYPGSSPEEVEEGICVRVEEAIQDLEGIKTITSTASEGMATIMVEIKSGYDPRDLLDDVKSRVDALDVLPEESEKPVISEVTLTSQVINIAVSGEVGEKSLRSIADQIRDDLLSHPEISQVSLTAARDPEISIEVSEESLRRYHLTFDEVSRAIASSSLDLPGGSIKTRGGEVSLRTQGQAYSARDFEDIVLRSYPDGTRLRIGDVAQVVDGFADTDLYARFDGAQTILVQIFRVGGESALTIADAVNTYVDQNQVDMPEGVTLTVWRDGSKILKDRLSLLLRNAGAGFILVFLALALFLRLTLAWWVVVGMAISFMGAFWVMPMADVSINLLSLFAFIMVLGIVVDDAIVLGENIYKHLESGKPPLRAAIEGAQEMAMPVIFAVLTTCAAFFPLLNTAGNMGQMLKVIPIIVLATILFSLFESLFILPSHLSHLHAKGLDAAVNPIKKRWRAFQDRFATFLVNFAKNRYAPFLQRCLRAKYITLATCVAIFIIAMSVVAGGWVRFSFFPSIESDNVVVKLTMPEGTPAEETASVIRRIEEAVEGIRSRLDEPEAIEHVMSTIGAHPSTGMGPGGRGITPGGTTSHLGEVNIQLQTAETRELSTKALAERLRQEVGMVPDVEELTYSSALMSAGDPISIQLAGADYVALEACAEELKDQLAEFAGVRDITDSFRASKREIKLDVTPAGEALGITRQMLARQIRQAFYGDEVQRIQRGRDEVKVMVRYPENFRRSLANLETMRIRTREGGDVPLSVAATIDETRGYASISRTDRKRTITVTADVDIEFANANEIVAGLEADVLPTLLARYPGVSYSLEGEQAEQAETMGSLARGFLMALLIIYGLLAIPFRSYLQPLIVMSAIPLGVVGAILGHILMGMQLTILSFFGIVALTGVVINDSLVMVDFINRRKAEGGPILEAIRSASLSRFRPIILTSVTTFLGLTPLLLEKSLQAQFLIPMATSLAFGVIFATTITLIFVPTLYYFFEGLHGERPTLAE